MMKEHPIDQYVTAVEAYEAGQGEKAAEDLAKALGGDKATGPIQSSLDKIFDKDSLIHQGVLDIITVEARKRRRGI